MEELDIDTSWIDEFEKYNDFYKEKLTNIKINFLFLDKHGELEKISTEQLILEQENLLTKESLIYIIKKQILLNKKQYSLLSIFKFNISLNNNEVIDVFHEKKTDFDEYITSIPGLDDIHWEDSINIFKDMNELNIILMKKRKNKHNTRRIYVEHKMQNKNTRRKYI